jgi:TPR repeat protein
MELNPGVRTVDTVAMFRVVAFVLLAITGAFAQFPGQQDVAALKLRAEAGDVDAQGKLAESYLASFYYSDAVKWYRVAAEKGVLNAQWQLGQILVSGKPAFPKRSDKVKADPPQGVRWLKKAASQGHDRAQLSLARCYEQGLGVTKDQAEAFKWFTLAARQNGLLANAHRDQLALKLSAKEIVEGQRRADAFVLGAQPSVWEGVALKGISGPPERRLALINGSTVAVRELFTLTLDGAKVELRCESIRESSVVLSIGTEIKELFLPR